MSIKTQAMKMSTEELRAHLRDLAKKAAAGDTSAAVKIEHLVDGGLRHRSGSTERDAIEHWLAIGRCFGFATQDDSFGELEKILAIVFRRMLVAEAAMKLHNISVEEE